MKAIFPFILSSIFLPVFSQTSQLPFPQHSKYFEGVIVPDHISQKELDDSTISFYKQWKQRYIKKSACSDSYYVWAENSGKNNECVSEGQGYGMIIVALMSGYEKSEQDLFDGLFKYCKEHPSKRSSHLVSWAQSSDCYKFEESSASDGDIDIAYSLLLANEQWKSSKDMNYSLEAVKILNAIKEQEINSKSLNILQSNSIESDSRDYFDMRSSDFIPSEFRAFSISDGGNIWSNVIDSNYALFNFLQKNIQQWDWAGPRLYSKY